MVTADHAHPMTLEERREVVLADIAEMETNLEKASREAFRKRLVDFCAYISTEIDSEKSWVEIVEEYLTGVDDAESVNAAANEIRHPWAFMPKEYQPLGFAASVTVQEISDALHETHPEQET